MRTEQKHAPGPWSADAAYDGQRAFIVDIEGHLVAMCPHNDPKRHANARLIAAAPALLIGAKAALLALTGPEWAILRRTLEHSIRRAEGQI